MKGPSTADLPVVVVELCAEHRKPLVLIHGGQPVWCEGRTEDGKVDRGRTGGQRRDTMDRGQTGVISKFPSVLKNHPIASPKQQPKTVLKVLWERTQRAGEGKTTFPNASCDRRNGSSSHRQVGCCPAPGCVRTPGRL